MLYRINPALHLWIVKNLERRMTIFKGACKEDGEEYFFIKTYVPINNKGLERQRVSYYREAINSELLCPLNYI